MKHDYRDKFWQPKRCRLYEAVQATVFFAVVTLLIGVLYL